MEVADARLHAEILGCETAVWQALATGDGAADRRLLSPGFLGVYPTGPAGRDAHAAALDGGATVAGFDLSAVQVRQLARNLALIVYRADFTRLPDGSRQAWWISSLWRRGGAAGWENLFSQDTPIPPQGD